MRPVQAIQNRNIRTTWIRLPRLSGAGGGHVGKYGTRYPQLRSRKDIHRRGSHQHFL